MSKLPPEQVKERLRFAKSVNWDPVACSKAWRIGRGAAKDWILDHRPRRREKRPEYENQRLFDLLVMPWKQWCEVWGIPTWEYKSFLKMYERQCGEKLATPERRAEWEKEYWEKMGE